MSTSPTPSPKHDESRFPQTALAALPVTPVKKQERHQDNITPRKYDATPTTSIRGRRGRKQVITNSTFRPLSIFTKSVLLPFDLNTEKAFDVLKGDSPDRLEEAKNALTPDKEESEVTETKTKDSDQDKQTPPRRAHTRGSAGSRETMTPALSSRDSDMDLITALQITSPEKDATSRITADFVTLCELPVPEPSQHPAFSSNPFEAKTDAPLLFTSTSIDEIRLYSHKASRSGSASKVGRESIERKRSLFGLELRTPASIRSRNAFSTCDDSPLPMVIPTPSSTNHYGSFKGSSPLPLEFVTPKESAGAGSNSSSVRKFSDLFRRKDSLEKSFDSPNWSPRNSQDSPNLDRHDLEKYLRRTTNAPTYDYDPYSSWPRHPNTGRGWKSRNLKCTNCAEDSCAVCRRVCCSFKAAVTASAAHGEGSSARITANQRVQEITKLFPYGRESPTFLQCTAGIEGDKAGCGKYVCPDCCSICPDDMCGDTLCRRCKPTMWEECDWHKGDLLMLEVKR